MDHGESFFGERERMQRITSLIVKGDKSIDLSRDLKDHVNESDIKSYSTSARGFRGAIG